MKITDDRETTILNFALYFMLVFMSAPTLAESEHGGEEEHEEGHIELSQEQIRHAGIGLANVEPGNIRETIPAYGFVKSNEEQTQSVKARFDGVIISTTKTIGDSVSKGEKLATVEADESLKSYSILSARDGVVTQRNANAGETTDGRTLFLIEDLSTVWVDLSVFPKDIAKVAIGQSARISGANSTASSEGNIIYVARLGNSDNQSTTVRVLLDNPDGQWKPGLFVSAAITLSETNVSTVINSKAVQIVEGAPVVFVRGEEGFEPREVKLGRSDGEFSEVISGLEIGETYVSENSFVLKSEMGKEDAEHGH